MKKALFLFSLLLSGSLLIAADQPVKPVVFALDLRTLETNKGRINSKDPSILPAYKSLIKDADKALDWGPVSVMEKKNTPPSGDMHDYMSLAPYHWPDPSKPNGLPYIRKDGETNPEVKEYKDKEYLPRLCGDVYTLGLAYYFSGERKYAEHAAKLLKVWFLDEATKMNPNLNFGQAIKGVTTGRGAGMIDTRHFVKLIDAIGLLNGSKEWKKEYQQGMQKWFASYLDWMQTSPIGRDEMDAGNNHGAWYDAQRLSMALFTGQDKLAKDIVKSAQLRLDSQMNNKGEFPKELERTIALHYTVFVMEAFFNIAEMATKTGIDFWNYTSPTGKSLQKGFDYLKPYISQEKKWEGQQIKDYEFEEGYPLLMQGSEHLRCRDCREVVTTLAGEKSARLRVQLLF